MNLIYIFLFLYFLPIFILYLIICTISPCIKVGDVKPGKGINLYIVKDIIHSDYVFESKDISNIFPSNKKFTKIGWGDRKIFLETKRWSDLKLIDFMMAFFGLNQTVLRVEYLDEMPSDFKKIDIDERQLEVLKIHIKDSYYGDIIVKKPNYYEKGDFYRSKLKYNCVTNCNNWVNYGLYLGRVTNRIWCPLSLFI